MTTKIILVLLLMVVFLFIMTVFMRKLSHDAGNMLGESIQKQMGSYDSIIEEKQMRLEGVEAQIKALEKKLRELEAMEADHQVDTGLMFFSKSNGFFDGELHGDYRMIREAFSFDIAEVVKKVISLDGTNTESISKPVDDDEWKCVSDLYEQLSGDVCYKLLQFTGNEQLEMLKNSFDEKQNKVLDQYIEHRNGRFDGTDRFIYWLNCQKDILDHTIYVLTADGKEELSKLDSRIVTVIDKNICEGVQVIMNRRLYDFAIRRDEIA